MNFSKPWIFSLAVASLVMGCSHTPVPPESARDPAAVAKLPDHANWDALEQFAANLDLSQSGTTLTPSGGGTSVYGVININGKAIGAIIPENSATVLSGEIMAFNLARAFHAETIYQPAFYRHLDGKNMAIFQALVKGMSAPGKLKAENKADVLARLAKNPGGIPAIFKQFGIKPVDYDALVSGNALNKSHVLHGSRNPIASYIRCDGPMPNQRVVVTMNGGSSNELFASMQLSTIFLIDALTQEWDRFSGGNLQTITTKEGVAKFISFDNGGTWGGTNWTSKFLNLVTRFDVNVANEILAMDDLFKKGTPYQELHNEAEFAQAMGIEKFPKTMVGFKQSLSMVAAHIRAHANCVLPPVQ